MQNFSAANICSNIPDKDLKRIIDCAAKYDEAGLRKSFGKDISKHFPGFRSIKSVPRNSFIRVMTAECRNNSFFAAAILETWVKANDDLKISVEQHLKSKGYETGEINYFSISTESLKPEDSLLIDEFNFLKVSDYKNLNHDQLLDSTLMSVLFGWYPEDGEVV